MGEVTSHPPRPRRTPLGQRDAQPGVLTCEITFWRGYFKAGFYASTTDAEGEEVAVAESPLYRFSGDQLPERTKKAVAAFDMLRAQLQREGWTYAGRGQHWFSERYQLGGSIPPEGQYRP